MILLLDEFLDDILSRKVFLLSTLLDRIKVHLNRNGIADTGTLLKN